MPELDTNTDEQSNSAISENPTEDQPIDNQEETSEEQIETGEQEQVEAPAPAVEEPAEQPKTRSERREENYINKLSEEIRRSSRSTTPQQPASTYQPLKYDEGDYDPNDLEKDRESYGKDQFQRGVSEAAAIVEPVREQLWAQQLDFDSQRAQQYWDILDESNKETFDAEFASELTQKYLNFIGYEANDQTGKITIDRPNIRWIDFVKAERQNLDRYAERRLATSTKNIVKQAAQTGIRPSAKSRTSTHREVDTSDPNWISKLTREEYDDWGRDLADKVINERLGIS